MPPARPRVTVIQNDAVVPLGRFAGWLDDVGLRLVRAWDGEEVPRSAADGLLVLGGRMDAYADDAAPWLPSVRRLIRDSVDADVPVLGICLGHQLIAAATGGEVAVGAPQGREAGLVEVLWESEAATDPLLGAVAGPGEVSLQYAMHSDAVTHLPPGAARLAGSERYAVQALRIGSAVGVQYHPEASPGQIGSWAELNGSGRTAPVVAAVSADHDDDVAGAGRRLARAFAGQVGDG